MLPARLVLAGLKHAAARGGDAQHIEEIRGDLVPLDALGFSAAPTMLALPPSQNAMLWKEVLSRRMSSASAGVLATQSLGSSGSRCITITSWSRLRQRQRLPQHGIADAESRCGSADAQRHGDDGGQGEAGRFAQRARAVAEVLPEAHVCSGKCVHESGHRQLVEKGGASSGGVSGFGTRRRGGGTGGTKHGFRPADICLTRTALGHARPPARWHAKLVNRLAAVDARREVRTGPLLLSWRDLSSLHHARSSRRTLFPFSASPPSVLSC